MAQARRPRGGCALRKMHRRFASTLGNECAPYLSPRQRDRRPRHQIATEPDRLSETSFGSRSDRNLQHAIALAPEGIAVPRIPDAFYRPRSADLDLHSPDAPAVAVARQANWSAVIATNLSARLKRSCSVPHTTLRLRELREDAESGRSGCRPNMTGAVPLR